MGSRLRFDTLLELHQAEIYRFACRMTGNRDDGADVLQETFLRAFKSFSKLSPEANHRAWLYRVAGRLALNLSRSKRVRNAVPIEEAHHLYHPGGDLESAVTTRRLADRLASALKDLPPRQRMALVQRKYEGLSYADIAEALNCSEDAARAHVYQAMTRIRRVLRSGRESATPTRLLRVRLPDRAEPGMR